MSASREKKNRQGDPSLSEKQRRAQQQAADAKRKHTLYAVIGVVAAVAVIALLVWDSGLFQKGSAAMTVNGREYGPGEVSYYYATARNQYSTYLQYMGYDSNKSDRDQVFDETTQQTYYDLFLGDAKELMVQTAALSDAAREAGVTLSEESKAAVDSTMETYKSMASQYGYPMASYLKANFGKYMTEELLRSCLEESYLASQFYTEHSDSLTYDGAALEAYYQENADTLDTFVYDLCFVSGAAASTTDAEGKTVPATEEEKAAAMAAAKQAAEELEQAVKNGGDFAVQANLAVNKGAASSYVNEGKSVGSQISTTYREWLADAARKAGDITVIESEGSGYYVIRFNDRFLDEESFASADIRHILIKAEVAEGASAPTDEAIAAAKEKAQAILDEFNAGAKTGEAFGELANANSEDPGSNTNGGLYTDVTRSTNFFTGFLNWIFEDGRQVGDTGLVENPQSGQQGWHVMYLDNAEGKLWQQTAENALRSADLQTWIEGLQEGYEAVEGSGIRYVG